MHKDTDRIRIWREKNPEKYRAQVRRRKPKVARKHKNIQLRIRYGMTIEQYDALLAAQNGVCAACASPPGKRALAVDHDHTSGVVRGLLCGNCNVALGLLYECPTRITALRDYINRYKVT